MRAQSARSPVVPSTVFLLALLAALPATAQDSQAPARVAVETASAAGLEIAIQRPFESAQLTLRRVGGEVVHRGTYTQTPIQLFPRPSDEGETLDDGAYIYELVVHPPEDAEAGPDPSWPREAGAEEPPGPVVVSDLFEIREGSLVPKGEPAARGPGGTAKPAGNVLATRDSLVNDDLIVEGSVCASDSDVCSDGESFLTPVFVNAQIKLKDTVPLLWFADVSATHDEWALRADANTFRIQNVSTGADAIFIDDFVPDNALFIGPSGKIGLGTSNPQTTLHMVSTLPRIHLGETDQGGAAFRIWVNSIEGVGVFHRLFQIRDGQEDTIFFTIDQDTGGIGLGTATPTAALDIAPPDGPADLRLASGDVSWRLTNRGEVMTVSRDGSEGDAIEIRDRHDAAGPTMVVRGSVQGTQVVNTSSRKHKTAFEDVDPAALLAALGELPVTAWRYRHEPEGTRHVGPVAEDFRALFGLGDGETISTVDALGVLMAAVQALHARLEEVETGAPACEAARAGVD